MQWEVQAVVPQDNYTLLLTFEDGEQRQFDMKPYLNLGVFRTLKDPAMFNTVRVCFDSIAWKNNVDIAPETLYQDSKSISCMHPVCLPFKQPKSPAGSRNEDGLTRIPKQHHVTPTTAGDAEKASSAWK